MQDVDSDQPPLPFRACPRARWPHGICRVRVWILGVLLFVAPFVPRSASAQSGLAHPHGAVSPGLECTLCHTVDRWTPTKSDSQFDHDRDTSFRILGSHADLSCDRCHQDFRFDGPGTTSAGCASCHLDVHQSKLGTRCASCHQATTFSDVPAVDIHARTFFPLTGAHLEITCDVCHTDERRGAFSGKDTACVECHRSEYERTRSPDHVAQGVSTRCEGCHGTLGWFGAGGIG